MSVQKSREVFHRRPGREKALAAAGCVNAVSGAGRQQCNRGGQSDRQSAGSATSSRDLWEEVGRYPVMSSGEAPTY